MTYKQTILYLLTWLLVGSNLAAQTTNTDKPKWEIGTDLLWLINKNTLPEYSVFSRWYYNSNRAIRFRIGTDIRAGPINQVYGVEKANIMIRLGHEWLKSVSIKTNLIWGIEAHYQKNRVSAYSFPSLTSFPFYYPENSWQVGGVAFIGCQYFINRNFSVSIESNFKAFYRNYRLNNYSFGVVIVTANGPISSPATAGIILPSFETSVVAGVFEVQPLQTFNFSYHF